jgi:hypothetical protein
MAFNHYVKIRSILNDQPLGWYIKRVDQPTKALNFKGEIVHFDHYYRIYDQYDQPIKYAKFQQLDRLASILGQPVEALPIKED